MPKAKKKRPLPKRFENNNEFMLALGKRADEALRSFWEARPHDWPRYKFWQDLARGEEGLYGSDAQAAWQLYRGVQELVVAFSPEVPDFYIAMLEPAGPGSKAIKTARAWARGDDIVGAYNLLRDAVMRKAERYSNVPELLLEMIPDIEFEDPGENYNRLVEHIAKNEPPEKQNVRVLENALELKSAERGEPTQVEKEETLQNAPGGVDW